MAYEKQSLLEKTILVAEMAMEQKRLKITDSNKKTYSIWLMLADGSRETKAYESIKDSLPTPGQNYHIKYSEKPNEKYPGAFNRSIMIIQQAGAGATPTAQAPSNDNERFSRLETRIAFIEGKLDIKPLESSTEPTNVPGIDPLPPLGEPVKEVRLEDIPF